MSAKKQRLASIIVRVESELNECEAQRWEMSRHLYSKTSL